MFAHEHQTARYMRARVLEGVVRARVLYVCVRTPNCARYMRAHTLQRRCTCACCICLRARTYARPLRRRCTCARVVCTRTHTKRARVVRARTYVRTRAHYRGVVRERCTRTHTKLCALYARARTTEALYVRVLYMPARTYVRTPITKALYVRACCMYAHAHQTCACCTCPHVRTYARALQRRST